MSLNDTMPTTAARTTMATMIEVMGRYVARLERI
jgi:hypothetical protein